MGNFITPKTNWPAYETGMFTGDIERMEGNLLHIKNRFFICGRAPASISYAGDTVYAQASAAGVLVQKLPVNLPETCGLYLLRAQYDLHSDQGDVFLALYNNDEQKWLSDADCGTNEYFTLTEVKLGYKPGNSGNAGEIFYREEPDNLIVNNYERGVHQIELSLRLFAAGNYRVETYSHWLLEFVIIEMNL